MLKLLLPALLPSWRFFDVIAPSPRIQYALLNSATETPGQWRDFRPRPKNLTLLQMFARVFWNPKWNESLFLVSCAERIIEQPTWHSEQEILKRILEEIKTNTEDNNSKTVTHFIFRLLTVHRQGEELQQEIVFNSSVQPRFIS